MKLTNKELKTLLDIIRYNYENNVTINTVDNFDIGLLYSKLHMELLLNESTKIKKIKEVK